MCNSGPLVDLELPVDNYCAGIHMCLIYKDEQERQRTIGAFVRSGLANMEKVAYFADCTCQEELRESVQWMHLDISQQGNQNLSISMAEQTYCPNGLFSPDVMLNTLREFYEMALFQGYPGCRVTGEMTWALRGIPGSQRLMEYEALVNNVLRSHPVTAICQYNANRFDGVTLFRCLEVHPFIIVHGKVVHNPYYMPPQCFAETCEGINS